MRRGGAAGRVVINGEAERGCRVRAPGARDGLRVDAIDLRASDPRIRRADFFGLAPNKTVRLLFGYNVTCTGVEKDETGAIVAIVFGVIAGCCIIGAAVYVLKRRQPPPPPAAYNKAAPPAY